MSEWTYTLDEVAELLCGLFDDECACNYNGIDEWLPMACKYTETGGCPHPSEKHGCWKQFLLQGAYTLKDIRQSESDTPQTEREDE